MLTDIQQALGLEYQMFFNSCWPTTQLKPIQTLDQSIALVNQCLDRNGSNLDQWSEYEQDQAARLLWVNWIYQRLSIEPIRKPILAHLENNQLTIDCGDTRLMALSLTQQPQQISVVAVDKNSQNEFFKNWIPVKSNCDLKKLTGFSEQANILLTVSDKGSISWLEIGDQTTAHHLHNVNQRVAMLQNYLNLHKENFRFSVDWARSLIDWSTFQDNR